PLLADCRRLWKCSGPRSIERGEALVLSGTEIEICQECICVGRVPGSRLVAYDAPEESFGSCGIVEGGGESAPDQRRGPGVRRVAQLEPPIGLRKWLERVLSGLGGEDRNARQSHDQGDERLVKHHPNGLVCASPRLPRPPRSPCTYI